MISDDDFDNAVLTTGLVISGLYMESMWEHGVDADMIKKIATDVAIKLTKIEDPAT